MKRIIKKWRGLLIWYLSTLAFWAALLGGLFLLTNYINNGFFANGIFPILALGIGGVLFYLILPAGVVILLVILIFFLVEKRKEKKNN